jgi:hypothetical protein
MRPQTITMHSADFGWLLDEGLIQWLTLYDRRPNLLIEAYSGSIDSVTEHVLAACRQPVLPSIFPGRLDLPVTRHGTVVLHNVHAMSIPQQIVLNDWIDEGRGGAQIVSISTTSVWQLVQNGDFLEGLFYRLSVIRLDATAQNGPPSHTERGGQYELPQA